MNKLFLMLILLSIMLSNSYASNQTEKQLLASWGVMQSENGIIEYKQKPSNQISEWLRQLPFNTQVDYSSMPVILKPLVLYGSTE